MQEHEPTKEREKIALTHALPFSYGSGKKQKIPLLLLRSNKIKQASKKTAMWKYTFKCTSEKSINMRGNERECGKLVAM